MNVIIFENKQRDMDQCCYSFKEDFQTVMNMAKPSLKMACKLGLTLCTFFILIPLLPFHMYIIILFF